MPNLPIREEAALAPGDVVLRGGTLAWDSLLSNAETCFARFQVHGVSVCAGPGLSVQAISKSVAIRRYPQFRVATVGALADIGFRLIPTFQVPHYTLDLGRPLDEALWEQLLEVFQ
jgi:hypothetical protein